MSIHKGEHPRMGATDVCPLIPVQNITMKECVKYSKILAKKVGDNLNIPIFLYENSAFSKDRSNLASIRKGEYEGMDMKLRQSKWKPDYGPSKLHKAAGVTAIGAREFLLAYNVNLNTFDKKIATDIALDIREAGRAKRDKDGKIIRDSNNKIIKKPGKLRFCKAVGWYIDEYKQAQVSINLTNYKKTSLHKTFEEIRMQARKRGVRVTGSEIVGLLPKQALINTGKYYLNKQKRSTGIPEYDILEIGAKSLGLNDLSEFKIKDKIIEYRINNDNIDFSKYTLSELVDSISRGTPTPGGGSVSAIAASLSSSLSAMVANLTIHKKGFESNYKKYISISENCQRLKDELMQLSSDDSLAYDNVINAIRLPKKTNIDISFRNKQIELATINAAEVPLKILEKCLSTYKQLLNISKIGNPNSITDIGVANELLLSGAKGAAYNVLINVKELKNGKTFKDKVDFYLKQVDSYHFEITENINKILNND